MSGEYDQTVHNGSDPTLSTTSPSKYANLLDLPRYTQGKEKYVIGSGNEREIGR
jgi:hypothetical protein